MRIVCIGQTAYDIIMPIHGEITENKKYRFHKQYESAGGPAMNAACLCALWGEEVQLISKIGNDAYGEKLLKIIHEYGINDTYLQVRKEIMTPYSYIFVNSENGSRTIFNRPSETFDVAYGNDLLPPDVILSDGHEPKSSIDLIQKFPQAASVLDAGSCRENTLAVAKYTDYLVCSKDFAEQYTNAFIQLDQWERCIHIFREIQKINQKTVVITLGEQGLLYEEQGEVRHLPAFPATVRDTTGAGDIFHGAFAYGVAHGMDLYDNLRQSSMASAISIQTIGGQRSIPTYENVQKQLEMYDNS